MPQAIIASSNAIAQLSGAEKNQIPHHRVFILRQRLAEQLRQGVVFGPEQTRGGMACFAAVETSHYVAIQLLKSVVNPGKAVENRVAGHPLTARRRKTLQLGLTRQFCGQKGFFLSLGQQGPIHQNFFRSQGHQQ